MKLVVVKEEVEKYGTEAVVHFKESGEAAAVCGRTRVDAFEETEEKVTCMRCIIRVWESGDLDMSEINPVHICLSYGIL